MQYSSGKYIICRKNGEPMAKLRDLVDRGIEPMSHAPETLKQQDLQSSQFKTERKPKQVHALNSVIIFLQEKSIYDTHSHNETKTLVKTAKFH